MIMNKYLILELEFRWMHEDEGLDSSHNDWGKGDNTTRDDIEEVI